MIRIVYDDNITDRTSRFMSSRQKIADSIKKNIIDHLVTNGILNKELAKENVNVVSGYDSISIDIGGLNNDDPLIDVGTEDEFYNTYKGEDIKDFLYKTINTSDKKETLKENINNIIRKIVSENALSMEAP